MNFNKFERTKTDKDIQQELNKRLDPNFEKKYQEVKPFIDKYQESGFVKTNLEKAQKEKAQKEKEQKEKDNKVIKELEDSLAKKYEPTSSDNSFNPIASELKMHSKEQVEWRAKNRMQFMEQPIEKSTLEIEKDMFSRNKIQERANNRIGFWKKIQRKLNGLDQ